MTTKTAKKTTTKSKSLPELPRMPFAFEVLNLASKQRSKAKKVEVLQKYSELSLKMILKWNYDTSIVSVLPEGEVPYSGFDDQRNMNLKLSEVISDEVRRMHEVGSFSLGSTDKEGHTTIRRETMFINILEGLHPLEAEIIVLVKDGRLEDRYKITKDVVATAYPDIVWGDA